MDAGTLIGRGIAFPPHVGADGRVAWSQGAENVTQAIEVILLTESGERILLPEFGGRLRTYLFEPNTVATRRLIQEDIQNALQRWEPRIAVDSVSVEADDSDPHAAIATIEYKLIATQIAAQTSVTVQLAG